jgi:hypothetical protein
MARILLLLTALLIGLAGPTYAQEPTIEFVQRTGEGNVLLRIDGTAYTALPDTIVRRLLQRDARLRQTIQEQEQKLALKDTLIAALDSTVSTYERSFRLQEGLLRRTTNLYEGYRELSDLYQQQYAEPIFNVSGGLGAMRAENNDVIPGVLAGLSIRRISLWGFVNQRQTGFIIGLNQPIQFGLFP